MKYVDPDSNRGQRQLLENNNYNNNDYDDYDNDDDLFCNE
jgi:hypothetical protein